MKYSIVTVCKNAAEVLESTITSVIGQKGVDFEYLILDGASTDHTVDIIKKFQKHISFWVSEPDSGIYPAMNKALTKAKGEWVYFLNAGDIFLSSHVLSDFRPILDSDDIVYGNVEMDTNKGIVINKFNRVNRWFWLQKTICHQAVFAKKQLFNKRGNFNSRYKIAADYEWLLRMVLKNHVKTQYTDLNIARIDMSGISNNPKTRNLVLSEYSEIRSIYFSHIENLFLSGYTNVLQMLVKYKNRTIK